MDDSLLWSLLLDTTQGDALNLMMNTNLEVYK